MHEARADIAPGFFAERLPTASRSCASAFAENHNRETPMREYDNIMSSRVAIAMLHAASATANAAGS